MNPKLIVKHHEKILKKFKKQKKKVRYHAARTITHFDPSPVVAVQTKKKGKSKQTLSAKDLSSQLSQVKKEFAEYKSNAEEYKSKAEEFKSKAVAQIKELKRKLADYLKSGKEKLQKKKKK